MVKTIKKAVPWQEMSNFQIAICLICAEETTSPDLRKQLKSAGYEQNNMSVFYIKMGRCVDSGMIEITSLGVGAIPTKYKTINGSLEESRKALEFFKNIDE